MVAFIFAYTFLTLVTKGDSNFNSIIGITGCSFGTYFIVFLHFLLSYLTSKAIKMRIQNAQDQKESLGYHINI